MSSRSADYQNHSDFDTVSNGFDDVKASISHRCADASISYQNYSDCETSGNGFDDVKASV